MTFIYWSPYSSKLGYYQFNAIINNTEVNISMVEKNKFFPSLSSPRDLALARILTLPRLLLVFQDPSYRPGVSTVSHSLPSCWEGKTIFPLFLWVPAWHSLHPSTPLIKRRLAGERRWVPPKHMKDTLKWSNPCYLKYYIQLKTKDVGHEGSQLLGQAQ